MTDEEKEQHSHPDGGYGWTIVACIIGINVSVLILVQNFGIIFEPEFTRMEISATSNAILMHLYTGIFCLMGLFSGPLLKMYSFRKLAVLGACMMCSGICGSSFAGSYATLLLTFSVLIGVGQGFLMPATYYVTNMYFKKKLTMAVSISVTGACIGQIVAPKMCSYLLQHIQRKSTVLVLFAISLISIPLCLLLKPIKREVGEKMLAKPETNPRDSVYMETTVKKTEQGFVARLKDLFDVELLRQRDLVIAVLVLGLSFAAEVNLVHMMQFSLPKLVGFTNSQVATASTWQSVGDVVGRLLLPIAANHVKLPPKASYAIALLVATAARTGIVVFRDSPTAVIAFCTLFGVSKGLRAVYQSVIIYKIVPFDKVGGATGFNMLVMGVATLTVGPILGYVKDSTNTFVYSMHVTSAMCVGCVVVWLVEWCLCGRRKEEVDLDATVEM